MLTLTFLGVGSAFAKRNYQSNALVEAWSGGSAQQDQPDDVLLIDLGMTGPIALNELCRRPGFGYLNDDGCVNYSAIRRIFVTHLHMDHVGGLEELAALTRHAPAGENIRPELIASDEVLENLWEHSLSAGLGVLPGRTATLEDYFKVLPFAVGENGVCGPFVLAGRYEMTPFRTDHVRMHRRFDWPSFGLVMKDRQTGETAVYSGDTRFDPETMGGLFEQARIVFHDVELQRANVSVHATLSELRGLPQSQRAKMLLYHYADDWDTGGYAFVADEFAGFAVPQTRYTLFA